jgi:hypothetical protein
MRVKRTAAGLAAVVTAVLGSSLTTTGPAAAAFRESGTWRPYGNTNPISSSSSTWACGASTTVATNVSGQVCAVRARDGVYAQAAAIVRNNRSTSYVTNAVVELIVVDVLYGEWACATSGVAAHSWSVCFGRTHTVPWPARAAGVAGVYGVSPTV